MARDSDKRKIEPEQRVTYGVISASIWKNEHKNGPWYSVTLQRAWKDDKDEWQYSETLTFRDLLVAAHVLQECYTIINQFQRDDRSSKRDDDDDKSDRRR